jgi:hypothetical protein
MNVWKNSEQLENIWLPNRREKVMVSLSTRLCTARSRPPSKQPKVRMAVYKGEGFPRFPTLSASEPRTQRSGVSGFMQCRLHPSAAGAARTTDAIDLEREWERC